ncbi:MAG: hypothetical protein B7Z23_05925, partial [Pseudomonadales bacterium 32-61-5]
MSGLEEFRASLSRPDHTFDETLAFIASIYDYQPCRFSNGSLENAAGENEGSCKTLGLAVLEGFTSEEALLAEIERLRPAELLLNEDQLLPASLTERQGAHTLAPWHFESDTALRLLTTQLKTRDLRGFGCEQMSVAIRAAG